MNEWNLTEWIQAHFCSKNTSFHVFLQLTFHFEQIKKNLGTS